MIKYSAYVQVDNYDDDFILLQEGCPIHEGTTSLTVLGDTPAEALHNLLRRLTVTDYNMIHATDEVPEGYRHVSWVQKSLQELADKAASGVVDEDDIHWGGNWDITFMILQEKIKDPVAYKKRDLIHELMKGTSDLTSTVHLAVANASDRMHRAAEEINQLTARIQALEGGKAKLLSQIKLTLRTTPNPDMPDDPYGTKAFLRKIKE